MTMKSLGLVLVVLGLFVALPTISAQETGQSAFSLVGKANQKWVLQGQTAENPTLILTPSTTITVTVIQEGDIPHNIQVGDNAVSGITETDGDTLEYTFTSPATGTLKYICKLHGDIMAGTMRVAGTPAENGGDEGNDSPGVGLVGIALAGIGAALLLRRK